MLVSAQDCYRWCQEATLAGRKPIVHKDVIGLSKVQGGWDFGEFHLEEASPLS